MSIFDKMKKITEKTTEAIKESTTTIKATYQEKGSNGVGELLGSKTKQIVNSTSSYLEEVNKEVSKVKPSAKQIPKDSIQYQASDVALKSIAAIGKVAHDLKKTVSHTITEKPIEKNETEPSESKPRKPKA